VTHRPYGTLLWFVITAIFIFLGIKISKTRSPEIASRFETSTPMDIVFAIAEMAGESVNIIFRRPREKESAIEDKNSIFVTFYTPRLEKPGEKLSNQYWIAMQPRTSFYNMIRSLLETIKYEIGDMKKVSIQFGWPMSSWLDRLSVSTMIYNITRLPKKFPEFTFSMNYFGKNETS
jgi:hypothetical protein